jgi:hypothetical protein
LPPRDAASLPSDSSTLRAATLLLVLFISRITSTSGVETSLAQRVPARFAPAGSAFSITRPRSLPPASTHRSATRRGAATDAAGAEPSSGARRMSGGGRT